MTANLATNEQAATILVVEDEEPIRELVTAALRFRGFTVEASGNGSEALGMARRVFPSLIVLDVNLPGMDGFELCRRLRAGGDQTPVIFLTARDDSADLRAGFTGGGDDYVTKPFSLEELVLRIEAVLRRTNGGADQQPSRLSAGDLVLDETSYQVWRGGDEIQLSPTEFRLLRFLLHNRGRVVSKTQILEHVWEDGFAGDPAGVETYVSYLRRKIDDRDGQLIRTVRGFGYTLRAPEDDRGPNNR